MSERRRAGRINARLWTQIRGVDTDWQLRRTNVSVTGVFMELDREVGEPGSVQEVHLMTLDRARQVEVMSRVVRVFSTNDIWRGNAVAGFAFDFMQPTNEARALVDSFLRHLLESRLQEHRPSGVASAASAAVQFSYSAKVEGGNTATVQTLSGGGMLLQTSWPAQKGEVIRCEISAPASKQTFILEGEVTNIVSELDPIGDPTAYQVEVRFRNADLLPASGPQVAPHGPSIGDAIDALLEEAVFHPPDVPFAIPNDHLRGDLARIRLASLLAFFEMEGLTGILKVTDGVAQASMHVREGRVLACELLGDSGTQLQIMQKLLTWQNGSFEFSVRDVHCADQIQLSTTHLLLRLAAAEDERNQNG